MSASAPLPGSLKLTTAISPAMVELYAGFYDHDHTTATTYITDHNVVCVPEDIPSAREEVLR